MEIIQNTASDESLETVNLFLDSIREHLASTDDEMTDTEIEYFLSAVLAKTLVLMRSSEWLLEPCVVAVYASQLKQQHPYSVIKKITEKLIKTA
ncbi:MAG: hypothetical protein RMY29_014485 [Nostoc sp. CreGUA01]